MLAVTKNVTQMAGRDGPPDLDELLRNLNRKLSGLFGKRGGGFPPNASGNAGNNNAGIGGFGILIAIVVVVWLASGFYIVNAQQRGVVLRFGKFVQETEPGAHWHLPYPIENVEVLDVLGVRSVEVGYRGAFGNKVPRESLMLTDDENIVDVQFAVQYVIKDPRDYLFNNRFSSDDAEDAVRQAAETAIREAVGKSKMDFVLYEGRAQVTADAQKLMQTILDRYQTGISISQVTMQNAQPPEQVQAAFDDAVKAGQDRDRLKNEGEAYANNVIPKASGTAARLTQEAEGYRQQIIERAQGDASRFKQIVVEYNKAPGVTRERLYLEAIEEIMHNTNKVMIDQKAGNNSLLYLPLDKLLQSATGASSSAPSASSAPAMPTAATDASSLRDRDVLRSREREADK